ncbi:MAG: ABC transporter ATP-binding protein [Candidatus Omnitrophica bacterium]|nr:ABC transporter ATP-binding protein [Candidatus Omnitrophota bacterium]
MQNIILKIENLTKIFTPSLSYSDLLRLNFKKRISFKALDGLSFSLEKGKILGILGPNGAGKTTLLKIIATLILPDKGTVMVNGYHLDRDDEKIKSLIGLVTSEERNFYWRLSGMQNLEFFSCLYGLNKKEIKLRIAELCTIFKADYLNKRFDSYSTGMKRKCALIKALLHNPKLLLLDEPTKSLDYNSAYELKNFISNEVQTGASVVFATHNIKEAEDLCDTFMILHHGKIYGLGTLNELRLATTLPNASLAEIYLKVTNNG